MPRIYADTPSRRVRQVVCDLAVAVWIVSWVVLGTHLHDLVSLLAVPGAQLADVGTSLSSAGDRLAEVLRDAPLVGAGLAAPFAAFGEAAGGLVDAGETTQRVANRLALWLSVMVVGAPISLVSVPYLWSRVRWSRRATAAARLRSDPGSVRLLALRAAVDRPLEQVLAVSQDPVRDLEERPELLAALELQGLGLRPAG
jgi:hypothetical protein